MKNNIVDSVYYIGAISTIMNYGNNAEQSANGCSATTQMTDGLVINADIKSTVSDEYSLSAYEVVVLRVSVTKGGKEKLILSFDKNLKGSNKPCIHDPKYSFADKFTKIIMMRPTTEEKIKAIGKMKKSLSLDELGILMEKAEQMDDWAYQQVAFEDSRREESSKGKAR